MDFTNIQTINTIVNDFLTLLKNNIQNTGHNSSGNLIKSTQKSFKWDGRFYTVSLKVPDYFKYLENGTKPHFPPVDKIKEWIRIKPILPRADKNGKLPTENQLAYLIGRKISKVGTKPTNLLRNTLSDFNLVGKVYEEFCRVWKEEQLKNNL